MGCDMKSKLIARRSEMNKFICDRYYLNSVCLWVSLSLTTGCRHLCWLLAGPSRFVGDTHRVATGQRYAFKVPLKTDRNV